MGLELFKVIESFGPAIGLIIFFIWRDWKREGQLSLRVETLEKYQRETLEKLVDRATTALAQSSECIKWIGRVLEHLVRVCPRIVGQDCDKPEGLR